MTARTNGLSSAVAGAVDQALTLPVRILARLYRTRFAKFETNFSFDTLGVYSYPNISIGNYVNLGYRLVLIASKSRIAIGNHVMFGPRLTIRGGKHRIELLGSYMPFVRDDEKRAEDDHVAVIGDDVWIGTRAMILGGVTVGNGAVVTAGAVVTHSVRPYTVVGGNLARILRMRSSEAEIAEHERRLARQTPQ